MSGRNLKKCKTYEEFVAKFSPPTHKKTTDDCYTPPDVYEVIKDFALAEYRKEFGSVTSEIVRPFYPGGDFENYDYPANVFVCDNPPFSIFCKILDFYLERDIKFFLFYDSRTGICPLKTRGNKNLSLILCNARIVYHNNANVNTCFYTNIYKTPKIVLSYSLLEAISNCESQSKKQNRQKKKRQPYFYSAFDLANIATRHKIDYDIEMPRNLTIDNKSFGYHIKITDEKINKLAGRVNGCLPDKHWCV